jgi:hypothetical protein
MKPLATKLLLVCGALLGMAVFTTTAAAAPGGGSHPKGSLLYVQETAGGSIERLGDGAYRLRLTGVSPRVTTFTDRPQRRAGSQGLEGFVGSWGANGFAADAPNAALVLDHAPASRDVALLTLSHPHYDRARQTLTYRATPLHGRETALTSFARRADPIRAGELGGASLFVDDGGSEAANIVFTFSSAEPTSNSIQMRLLGSNFSIGRYTGLSFSISTPISSFEATSTTLYMGLFSGTTFTGTVTDLIQFQPGASPAVEVTNFTGTVSVSWPTNDGPETQILTPGEPLALSGVVG